MPRYFIELSYKGTNYSGFQVQENAKTIQQEVTEALATIYRQPFQLTGSSRTDAGVHALQNYFHFDTGLELRSRELYNLNALLSPDIVAKAYYKVDDTAHCRFGAVARQYKYFIYNTKQPFLYDRGWYYPYRIDTALLHEAAEMVLRHTDFTSFAKRNTQVNNFNCRITESFWSNEGDQLVYQVKANRFLRGMVRALVSSMLKLARGSMDRAAFRELLEGGRPSAADFSAPPQGLFLVAVVFPEGYLGEVA
ncbi:MAG TPA: tRNA pseudouridine(38-40) synthase TruA [Chitinophagaceae bacterium]